ncbi:MAG TPA: energy transducer TonB [Steroidobacteraceae bacterium]|nr:energy transducer TonB [Steroidobacteraceae bacterium]
MAVQLINDMPDAEVHRGEPVREFLRALNAPRAEKSVPSRTSGRATILGATIALHVIAIVGFLQMKMHEQSRETAAPIIASLIEAPAQPDETPPQYTPPPMNVVYSLPTPQDLSIETETAITVPEPTTNAIAPNSTSVAPPMIDSVEYVRAPPPVYPRESQRKREHGTVVLRVLVDALGRPAQIQVERSSGHERLDTAARDAVSKFLFRPYEVDGIAKPAQVLIPIGFEPRAS